jgi:DNA polymerase-1
LKTITIIDTFGFFFRAYFALPPLRNSDGFPTGLLTGFINLIDGLKRDYNSDYIVFALDTKEKSFRDEIYPNYKANRADTPKDLIKQLPIAIEWIERMGFANISKDGYEADDVIATLTTSAKKKGIKVRIVSHDKDLYQMIDDGKVIMYDSVKKKEIDRQGCIDKFGVQPEDFTNFQAIVGDSSDNIIGVKGIGQKGASKLINEFHTLENIYNNIDRCGTPRTQKLLLESRDMAFLSRDLVTLRRDIFKDFNFENFLFEDKNYLAPLIDDFRKYEMKQAIKRASPNKIEEKISFQNITLDNRERLFKIVDTIKSDTIVAFDIETTGLDIKKDRLVGFSFAIDGKQAYYVPINHSYLGVTEQIKIDDGVEAIKKILRARVVGQNLKFDLALLYYQFNIEKIVPYADTMIMAWLLNPSGRVGLDSLALKFFDYQMKPFKEIVKRGETFASVDIELASFYASEDAWMTYKLYFELEKRFDNRLKDELREVEYPFINILISMEQRGIKVDTQKLKSLQDLLTSKINELTDEIYRVTNREFNIKSTKQLGSILFEDLGLKGGKRTKTGYSTNESVLKSLVGKHEVIEKILDYRAIQKLLSTYASPLLKLAKNSKESRIYTSFLQTGTATGRLSSKEPNLQNIPVRSKLGNRIREAFIAKDGYRLLSIDYSQIELRLLAHFSKDDALMDAFNNNLDIHTTTAIKLFGEERAKDKRATAKSINFGILYGMGSKKLSDELKITTKEAKEIIKNYFDSFPTVRNFLEKIRDKVKRDGFVETILKRKRFFDYNSANGMQKSAFMRESINTVFQGSASDLIKLSMLKITKKIEDENIDGSMLLQIHDELIFEIREDIINDIAIEFKNIMEGIYRLNIPLKCSVNIANSWGELK